MRCWDIRGTAGLEDPQDVGRVDHHPVVEVFPRSAEAELEVE
jgi:hypothetical protein